MLQRFASDLDLTSLPQSTADTSTMQTIFTIVVGVLAAVAVLIIVLAGLKYITSSGDPNGVASARKAIVYALVGLAVCFASWALVTFVLKGF